MQVLGFAHIRKHYWLSCSWVSKKRKLSFELEIGNSGTIMAERRCTCTCTCKLIDPANIKYVRCSKLPHYSMLHHQIRILHFSYHLIITHNHSPSITYRLQFPPLFPSTQIAIQRHPSSFFPRCNHDCPLRISHASRAPKRLR